MSRIGKKEIQITDNISIEINQSTIFITGKQGKLFYNLPQLINIEKTDNKIKLIPKNSSSKAQELHGLSRSIIYNMIIGVSKGFRKKLVIQGVGYRSQIEGNILILHIGYSHVVQIKPPENITIQVENNTNILISGINKELVGQVAAKIRAIRPPEPYKGKGIRYENENIRRKVGKAGK